MAGGGHVAVQAFCWDYEHPGLVESGVDLVLGAAVGWLGRVVQLYRAAVGGFGHVGHLLEAMKAASCVATHATTLIYCRWLAGVDDREANNPPTLPTTDAAPTLCA
jgi:hypothetical protein